MAVPDDATEERLFQAILKQLERIKSDGRGALWLSRPAVVGDLMLGMPPQGDLPAIYLHLQDWNEGEDIIGQEIHEATAQFIVSMMTTRIDGASKGLRNMARDVRKAIADGESAIERSLSTGAAAGAGAGSVVIRGVGYTYSHELSERLGLCVGLYTFTVRYVWSHQNL